MWYCFIKNMIYNKKYRNIIIIFFNIDSLVGVQIAKVANVFCCDVVNDPQRLLRVGGRLDKE